MKRIPLTAGAVIHGDGENGLTYIIDRVIGDGAESIVYAAHYTDSVHGRHNVRLKECYPFASEITRVGDKLVWADEAVQIDDKANFLEAYQKLLHFQNTANLTNSMAHVFSVCEANGTLYSVMDLNIGITFEKEKTEKLSDILKTGLALTKVIQKYHDNGYLHLDIKPGNFLVLPETREMVVLFDVDSVTAMEDISSGKVRCVSYSKGWGAPEQMQGQLSKICPATDIFSIGAVLFEKIMGHTPANEDIGVFADWDFDGTLFDKVNPKIKRLLREIFRKTLAANVRRRYQSAGELIIALEEAVKTAEQVQYIRSNCPAAKSLFLGREKELTSISDAFSNGKKCVIIQGYMGMGKSSLALQYASEHRDEYDVVCWSMVNADLIPTSMDADSQLKSSHNVLVVNGSANRTDPQVAEFQKLVTNKTLLIIDNYDVPTLTPYIEELLALDCKILITTRTVFRNLGTDIFSLQLQELSQNDLLDLFEKESGQKYEDTSKLFDFFESQHNLTYIIVLAAAQIRESYISLDEYLEDIYSQRYLEDIYFNGHDDQLLNHYRRIMRLHLLSEEQKEVLRTVFVMSYAINSETKFVDSKNGVFDRAVFKAYTGMNLNALNSLIRNRIVHEDVDGELSLHPSVKEIIRLDMNPTCQNCPNLYRRIKKLVGFDIDQTSVPYGVVCDVGGIWHDYEETRIYELFDIYTWLYSSDENRISHLYNLFCLLTENDFEFEFDTYIDGHPLWHLEWINRNFFIYRLFEDLQSDEGKLLFNNARYILQIPKYNIEHRANTAFIRICCALLRYLTLPYYDEDYDLVFNCLSKAFFDIQKKLITEISNNMEISEEQFELLDDIIDITEPIFSKCCSISKEGDYNIYIEDAPANVVNPADNIDDFPLTVGLCAYYAENTYVLYQFVHFFLRLWITYFEKIGYAENQINKLEKRLDWEREICVELYRIDKGFNHFFDFYYETPEYYCGISNIAKDFNGLNEVYVDSGFDENTEKYFSEIFETLETSPHPFYLYKLLLNPDFPVSDCLYDRLIDADFGHYILKKGRLTEDERTEILEFAMEKFSAEFMKSDSKNVFEIYRWEQSERFYRYNNGVFEQIQEISDDDIIIRNHIVVLLDQVIKSLTPDYL